MHCKWMRNPRKRIENRRFSFVSQALPRVYKDLSPCPPKSPYNIAFLCLPGSSDPVSLLQIDPLVPNPAIRPIKPLSPIMSTTTTTIQTKSFSLSPHPSSSIPRGPVDASLNFFDPPADGSVPFDYVEPPADGSPQTNYTVSSHPVRIDDIRGSESAFNLDKHAFAAVPAPPGLPDADFADDASIRRTYYPEVERLLLTRLAGHPSRVVVFDHTVRRALPDADRAPVQRVHVDQTPASAARRVRSHVRADEAERILALGERVRLVNVWRPLNGAVESFPLAVADSSSLPADRVVAIERRYPTFAGQTAGIRYDEATRWYYWSGMTDSERLLLQCYDSESGARVPHTAFEDPRAGEGAKPRESIEVRALVFG